MSNVKISALPTGSVASTDLIPVVKAGVTTGVTFGHTHPQSDVTSLVTDLAGKAASSHTHAESDVTSLVSDLAGKAASSHTHAESDVTNLVADLAAIHATTSVYTALDQSGWSWLNQGSATIAQGSGVVSLYKPVTDTGTHVRGRIIAVPSTPWTMTMAFVPVLPAAFSTAGFILYDGTKCYLFAIGAGNPVTSTLVQTYRYASVSSNTTATGFAYPPSFLQSPIYVRLTDDGTNNIFQVSMNGGRTYFTFLTEARGAFLTATHVGIALDGPGTATLPVGMEVLHWVQS